MMKIENSGVANINGNISDLLEAKIPLSDRGFLFGHSIFETLLVKNGKIMSWKFHFARMKLSCQEAFIKCPNEDVLYKWSSMSVEENIKQSGTINEKAQLRIIISGGNSFDLPIKRQQEILPEANIMIICRNVSGPSKENYLNGISLKCIPDLRSPALVEIKSCSYLYNLIAIEKARKDGFDDALFYNSNNIITESTSSNFIWFDKNLKVSTIPFQGSCLAGITLTRLISGMKKMKIMFDWNELNRTNIVSVLGCGIISSIRGIVPIRQIDNNHFDTHSYQCFFEKLNQALQSEES
jgi:branched-subunit amino acid aminotransferase/4-amino-4-deoxychorismate lyase